MIKSTDEFRNKIIENSSWVWDYNGGASQNNVDIPEFPVVGGKYVIAYCNLKETINGDLNDYTTSFNDCLIGPEFDSFYTVVEYGGEGLFKDLVTGYVFNTEVRFNNVLDLVTDEYKDKSGFEWLKNTEFPLAISSYDEYGRAIPNLHELTRDRVLSIMKDTIPNKDAIVERLDKAKGLALNKVNELYSIINNKALVRNSDDKLIEEFYKEFGIGENRKVK